MLQRFVLLQLLSNNIHNTVKCIFQQYYHQSSFGAPPRLTSSGVTAELTRTYIRQYCTVLYGYM